MQALRISEISEFLLNEEIVQRSSALLGFYQSCFMQLDYSYGF